jgi:hypothetical protein
MRNDIQLTDDQIEQLFEKAFRVGLTVDDLVFTRNTLAEFDAATDRYTSCGAPKYGVVRELKTLFLANAQPRKGDQRRDVHIIDFGAVRGVY